ncbi:MAG: GAF domain-containing protein [Halorientalis sp.]
MSRTVLCVDGDDDERAATVEALADDETAVATAPTVAGARALLAEESVDCLVTEYDLPDGTGLALLETVRDRWPDTPCVMFTHAPPEAVDTEGFGRLVVEYLHKGRQGARERLGRLVGEVVTRRSQVGYPLPADEDGRLAALSAYDLSSLPTRAALDRLTELAGRHFDVDRAFVGVVRDHHEEFVACYGPTLDRLEREQTMCTYTVAQDEALVVEDVGADDRFAGNETLERLGIRSYVGVPIRTPDGAPIGSFCVTDDEPRSFSAADVEFLRLLAEETGEQLELRRRLEEAGGEER